MKKRLKKLREMARERAEKRRAILATLRELSLPCLILVTGILWSAAPYLPADTTSSLQGVLRKKANAGAGGGGGGITLQGSDYKTNPLSTSVDFVVSDVPLGDADSNRRFFICVHGRSANSMSLDKCDLAGVSATLLASNEVDNGSGTLYFIAMVWVVSVPTGTLGDLELNAFANNWTWVHASVYRWVGSSVTAYDTATHGGSAGTTIDVPANGVIVGAGSSASTGPAATMTGLTEAADELTQTNDDVAASGYYEASSLETGRSVRINMGNSTYDTAAFVSVAP